MVQETGRDVKKFRIGDAVYIRLPEVSRGKTACTRYSLTQLLKQNTGSCSEFVRCSEEHIGLKPPSLSFEEAASIPLAAMTALQALRLYRGDLAGKTVFVPAGCSTPNGIHVLLNMLMTHSERNRLVRMPTCQACFPCW